MSVAPSFADTGTVPTPFNASRIEQGDSGSNVTTVAFEETAGKTRLTVSNLYPSKEALEADGSTAAMPESLDQLEELLASLG